MEQRFTAKNVDLSVLADRIAKFLEVRGFSVQKAGLSNGFKLLGRSKIGDVSVKVIGKPDDFTVDLSPVGGASSVNLGMVTSILGGGGLLLRRLKSEEAFEMVKADFLGFINDEMTIRLRLLKKKDRFLSFSG